MAERVQKQKTTAEKSDEIVDDSVTASRQGDKIKADLDGLLDEIDEVLEENAEEFVKSYIQKGGQ